MFWQIRKNNPPLGKACQSLSGGVSGERPGERIRVLQLYLSTHNVDPVKQTIMTIGAATEPQPHVKSAAGFMDDLTPRT